MDWLDMSNQVEFLDTFMAVDEAYVRAKNEMAGPKKKITFGGA